jgi:transcription elongation factor SPT4
MTCTLVKTYEQFYNQGCENCTFLHMEEDPERVKECTSAHFDGLISMITPDKSWVARYQGVSRFHPGCYAVSVTGILPDHVEEELREKNIAYIRPQEP